VRSTKGEGFAIGKTRVVIPVGQNDVRIEIGGHELALTNLHKLFWPQQGISKHRLLQYYADISPVLLPHLKNRAMVMKRYPSGADGPFFFQKRIPEPHPDWVETCEILHASGNRIHFPMIQNLASLLWAANLGCIDLNQWYATCDEVNRPDYLHFDLDPGPDATFQQVLDSALALRSSLTELKIPAYPKTSGSRGIHVYVPIRRGPAQKQVWSFAKELAKTLATRFPKLITAEYRKSKRPAKHVLVDYNQNAWGRTLASVYSARPMPRATVSTPVGWDEIERGIKIEDFRIDNVPDRVHRSGDLFHPLLLQRRRLRLEQFL
jgi:bifunctional non-homologous end joining protein LigD